MRARLRRWWYGEWEDVYARAMRQHWAVLRRVRGQRGTAAVEIRRAAHAALCDLYGTPLGKHIGFGERLARAGVVWSGDERP